MNTKFFKIENIKYNGGGTAILSLISSFAGIDDGKVLTISHRPTDCLMTTQLTLNRKQVRELQKQLTKWLDGKPLDEIQ